MSHGKLLKLIGDYFEMHASIKLTQIDFKIRHFEVYFVHKFIMINNIFIHFLKSLNLMINIFEVLTITTRATINSFSKTIQNFT